MHDGVLLWTADRLTATRCLCMARQRGWLLLCLCAAPSGGGCAWKKAALSAAL